MSHESKVRNWQIQKNIAQLESIDLTQYERAWDRDLSLFSVIKQHLAHGHLVNQNWQLPDSEVKGFSNRT